MGHVHTNIHDLMPARVEYRLGSIFDEECDILVIPTWIGGKVSPDIAEQLQKFWLPSPPALAPGKMEWLESPDPRFGTIVYAGIAELGNPDPMLVAGVGAQLGRYPVSTTSFLPSERRTTPKEEITISVPPLTSGGAGDWSFVGSVAALERGFLMTAAESAVLVINVPDYSTLATLVRENPRPVRDDLLGFFSPANKPPRRSRRIALRSAHKPQLPTPGLGLAVPRHDPPPPEAAARPERTRVFISYSHEDAKWLKQLQKHLRPLERDGALVWDDSRLKAGASWRDEIRRALAETKVAVLLVSAAFMDSEFIHTDELPPLLKAAEEDGATILPVIISASRFDRTPSLSRFQAVNNPNKPLAKLPSAGREEVLDKVARAVEDALKG